MRQLESASEDIKMTVTQFDTQIQQTQGRNSETLHRVVNCTDRIFMSLAKLDHIIWKVNTYRSVIEKSPQFAFVDCHNCRLGKWYYEGDGHASFSNTPAFPQLEKPHAIVHNATKQLFDLLESENEQHDIQQFADALSEMEKGSDGVFTILDQILSEKQ